MLTERRDLRDSMLGVADQGHLRIRCRFGEEACTRRGHRRKPGRHDGGLSTPAG